MRFPTAKWAKLTVLPELTASGFLASSSTKSARCLQGSAGLEAWKSEDPGSWVRSLLRNTLRRIMISGRFLGRIVTELQLDRGMPRPCSGSALDRVGSAKECSLTVQTSCGCHRPNSAESAAPSQLHSSLIATKACTQESASPVLSITCCN